MNNKTTLEISGSPTSIVSKLIDIVIFSMWTGFVIESIYEMEKEKLQVINYEKE